MPAFSRQVTNCPGFPGRGTLQNTLRADIRATPGHSPGTAQTSPSRTSCLANNDYESGEPAFFNLHSTLPSDSGSLAFNILLCILSQMTPNPLWHQAGVRNSKGVISHGSPVPFASVVPSPSPTRQGLAHQHLVMGGLTLMSTARPD